MRTGSIIILASALLISFSGYSQEAKKEKKAAQQKEQSSRKSSMMHYTITVHGKVQDVGFRKSAKDKAEELGIKGEARNEPDGTVFIEAEGSPEQLEKFIAFCKEGPDKAEVRKVNVKKSSELKHYTEFDVDRLSQKDRRDSTKEEKSDKKSDHKGHEKE